MKAVILAAGEGMRMRPLTLEKPKPMLKILGRPILDYIFEALPDEIKEVIMVIGYKGDMIRNYFGDKFPAKGGSASRLRRGFGGQAGGKGRKITYITQAKKLGNGHALRLCRPYLNNGEKFLLLFADDLQYKEEIKKLFKHQLAMMACRVTDPKRFGIIVADKQGKILDIEEKPSVPKTNLAATGVYVLDNRIFDYEPSVNETFGEYLLTDMIKAMIKDYDFFVEETSFWHPIGYPEDLIKAEKLLLGN